MGIVQSPIDSICLSHQTRLTTPPTLFSISPNPGNGNKHQSLNLDTCGKPATRHRMLPEPSDLQTENTKTNTKTNNNHKLLKTCKT